MDYFFILKLHIIFAGIWLINLATDALLRRYILNNKGKIGEKKLVHLYLTFANLFGMVGALGILITGIAMVAENPAYGFFSMSSNHWLATKQILMVVLLILLGAFIIPTAKRVRAAIGKDLENGEKINEEGYKSLQKLFRLNNAINMIVLINFLLAITHGFFGS